MRTVLTAVSALAFVSAVVPSPSEACCVQCEKETAAAATYRDIARDDLKALLASETRPTLVDVLSPEAFNKTHIPGAINIPLEHLDSLAGYLDKNVTVVTTCAGPKCPASTRAAERLVALGFRDVRDYKGGIQDWMAAGLAVDKGDPVRFIQREDLKALRESGKPFTLVDVLTAVSYNMAHIAGAVNIPFADLERRAGELDKEAPIVVYCYSYSCNLSTKAAALLTRLGFKDVRDYKGGYHEWKEARLPLEGREVKPPADTAGPAGPVGAAAPVECPTCTSPDMECPLEPAGCCPADKVNP